MNATSSKTDSTEKPKKNRAIDLDSRVTIGFVVAVVSLLGGWVLNDTTNEINTGHKIDKLIVDVQQIRQEMWSLDDQEKFTLRLERDNPDIKLRNEH